MIEIGALVSELSLIRQYQETVRKALRNVELLLILCSQLYTKPLAVGFGIGTQVYCYIKDCTADGTHQLALRILFLEMQAAQYALHGHGLVVLYKYHVQTGFLEVVLVVSLYEVTALILEYGWLDHIKSFYVAGCHFDLSHCFLPHFSFI